MKTAATLFLAFLFTFLWHATPAMANVDKYDSLGPGENLYYGRILYVRPKDIEAAKEKRKLGLFEGVWGEDKWKIATVALCFEDGTKNDKGNPKQICREFQTTDLTPARGADDDQVFAIRSAKPLRLSFLAFGNSSKAYIFKMKPQPKVSANGKTGYVVYIGDMLVGAVNKPTEGKENDLPRLSAAVINGMGTTTKLFGKRAQLPKGPVHGTRSLISLKGVSYGAAAMDRHYTTHYHYVPGTTKRVVRRSSSGGGGRRAGGGRAK